MEKSKRILANPIFNTCHLIEPTQKPPKEGNILIFQMMIERQELNSGFLDSQAQILFFFLINFYWSIVVDLQCCPSFCYIVK